MPQRLQLSRKKGWRLPPGAVSVARPGRWGNPFVVTHSHLPGTVIDEKRGLIAVPSAEEAVRRFREWLETTPSGQLGRSNARTQLRGRDLACWCAPGSPCHADVLLEIANASDTLPERECP